MVGAAENHHQSLIVHRKLRLGRITAIRIAEFVRMSDPNRALGFPVEPIYDRGSWSEPLVPHVYSNVISDDSE